jgi:hypothetical protein
MIKYLYILFFTYFYYQLINKNKNKNKNKLIKKSNINKIIIIPIYNNNNNINSDSETSVSENSEYTESSIFKYIMPENNICPSMYKINFLFSNLIFIILIYIYIKKYCTNVNYNNLLY